MIYWQDVRYALRQIRRAPGVSALTVVVLSGGLAISLFTFSFLYTATIKPLPVPEGRELVQLQVSGLAGTVGIIDAVDIATIRSTITTLTDVGVYMGHSALLGEEAGACSGMDGRNGPERVDGMLRNQWTGSAGIRS